MTKESPTIQVGLRIEKDLLDQIEFFAEQNKIDKMSIIRQAIALYVGEMESAFEHEAIKDFIAGRIDEATLKKYTNLKNIPEDLKQARADVFKEISKEVLKNKNG